MWVSLILPVERLEEKKLTFPEKEVFPQAAKLTPAYVSSLPFRFQTCQPS
jgi:hypothetical protein